MLFVEGILIFLIVDDQVELNIFEIGFDFGFYKFEFIILMGGIEGVFGLVEGYI